MGAFRAPDCIKAAGLADDPQFVRGVMAKYTLPDQRFRWLDFVKTLEKKSSWYATLPRSSSKLSQSPNVVAKLKLATDQLNAGSQAALPPLLRVATATRTLQRSPSLLLRGPGVGPGVRVRRRACTCLCGA